MCWIRHVLNPVVRRLDQFAELDVHRINVILARRTKITDEIELSNLIEKQVVVHFG